MNLSDLTLIAKLPSSKLKDIMAELTPGQQREVNDIRADLKSAKTFQVKAYSKTGIYTVEIEATHRQAALRNAMPILKKMAFGKIIETAVTLLS